MEDVYVRKIVEYYCDNQNSEETIIRILSNYVNSQHQKDMEKFENFLIGFTTYPYTHKGNVSKKLLDEFRYYMEKN